jgi:membrane associated rhomboid family serine protease
MLNGMSSEHDYRARPRCPVTFALLVVNVIIWLLESWAYRSHSSFPVEDYFALSLDGLRHGRIWQLLTFQFMHDVHGPWHLLLNSWAIYVFGRVVEMTMGKRRMLELYLLSGVVGGLVQMLGTWVFPGFFGDAGVVGASAGAFGLVAAFAVLYPRQELNLLLFFILPVRLRATTLLWLSVAIGVFGLILPWLKDHSLLPLDILDGVVGDNVAHAAHLGGIMTGYLLARQLARGFVAPPPVINPPAKSSLNINAAPD